MIRTPIINVNDSKNYLVNDFTNYINSINIVSEKKIESITNFAQLEKNNSCEFFFKIFL